MTKSCIERERLRNAQKVEMVVVVVASSLLREMKLEVIRRRHLYR